MTIHEKKSLRTRIGKAALAALACLCLVWLGRWALSQEKTITIGPEPAGNTDRKFSRPSYFSFLFPNPLPQDLERPFNILILGESGEGYIAPDLTDSIIILHLEPGAEATLISVPRDLWVQAPGQMYYSKINALANADRSGDGRFEAIKKKIDEITGLTIDYYVLVDITALKELVDSLGGIDVYAENNINDQIFQHLKLDKGWHHLDGATVQKYVRTRVDTGGDFARIGRQQQVLAILKDKIFELNPVWDLPKLIEIYRNIGRNVKTDIELPKIQYFFEIARLFQETKFQHLIIDARPETDLLKASSVLTTDGIAFILIPKAGLENYAEIRKYVADNL